MISRTAAWCLRVNEVGIFFLARPRSAPKPVWRLGGGGGGGGGAGLQTGCSNFTNSGFGGLVVSMLASGTQVRGFKPGRSRRIFQGEKILSMPSFGREVKPSVLCRSFAACKRTLQLP